MNLMHEDLARRTCPRAWERRSLRRGHQLAMARRLFRRAERAARRRVSLARSL